MPSGRDIKAALKKAAAWGTPVACGVGDGILLTGDSFKRSVENEPDNSLGVPFIEGRDTGEIVTLVLFCSQPCAYDASLHNLITQG